MNYPKVSIIIPTYNRANLLSRAIKSVLNQTFKDFELIIVDDGSTDNTKGVVEEFQKKDSRIKYIWQENSGAPAKPKNTGIRQARGEYVAFLDDDDEWFPKKLEKQIELFEDNIGFVGCNILIVDQISQLLKKFKMPEYPYKIFFEKLLGGDFTFTSSIVVVKREVLDEFGFFDENLKFGDDWDLWLRISKKYRFAFVPDFLVKYYIHQGSTTPHLHPEKEAKEFEYIFSKYQKDYRRYPVIYSMHLRKLASRYCASGKLNKGRKYYVKSIKLNPLNLKSYLYLLLSFLGERTFRKIYDFRKSLNK